MSVTTVINGKSYWTTTPIPADRADAPAVVEWSGYELIRQPSVYYGDFLGWWNVAEAGRLRFMVDGGRAHVLLVDDEENCVIGHAAQDAANEHDALNRASLLMSDYLAGLRRALTWKETP